ncbi:MAG: hypothetical protein ACR2GL_04230 [Thermoleophilaceae bacterium]
MTRLHLKSHAEAVKLGRVLGVEPERLGYLERLGPEDLRAVRELATDAQYAADAERFQRIAFASRLLPVALTALIAQRVFGPLLGARVAGVLEADHAIALADRMPPDFLADLAAELDPRRCSEIIAGMPAERIAEVAAILTARGDHVTMGRFVGHMTDAAITASLEVIDEPSLLRISYVLEGDAGLERVIALMSREQLGATIRAAGEHDLWPEALNLLGRVSEPVAGRLGDIAAGEDDAVLAGMVRVAQDDDLWDAVLPVTRVMSEPARERFAALPAIHARAVLASVVRAAMLGGSWRDLLPLVAALPREARLDLWAEALATAESLPAEQLRERAGEAVDLGIDDALPDILAAADAADLWPRGLRLLAALGPDLQRRLAPAAAGLPAPQRAAARSHAHDLGLLGELGPLGEALA